MKNHIFSGLIALAVIGMTVVSCTDVDIPDAVSSQKVTNLAYSVDGRTVTLTWTLPSSSDLSGIQVIKDNSTTTSLGVVDSYEIQHVSVNTEVAYTVKCEYSDGRVSEGETVRFTVESDTNMKLGYLIPYSSVDELEDDDEIAAAAWFLETYEDGVILTPDDFDDIYVDEISVIWVHVDREDIEAGYENLPAELISTEALNTLSDYLAEGGNLLLTKHATQLITAIGRIESQYAPGLIGTGSGSEGTDIWTTNAVVGSGQSEPYDHRSHALFSGLEVLPAYDDVDNYDHESYPLIGPGIREDHNSMWDLNSYGFTDEGDNVVLAFENVTTSSVLSTWGHVTDYCCAGIVEFYPTDDYDGTCIAIGLSAYEWNQNSGTNVYQSNTEGLTKNALDYLYN